MSKIDENEIRTRLKRLSQVEPTRQAADRAIQRTRRTLMNEQEQRESTAARIRKAILKGTVAKLAAAAVILIGLGYVAGRLSAPRPLDVDELQAALESSLKSSLEPALRRELLEQVGERQESAFAANLTALKEELQQQFGRDLTEFAQTLATSRTLTDQRFRELIQLIEAARRQDRLHIEAALEKIELNRWHDKARLGNGLVTLAARTNELRRTEQN